MESLMTLKETAQKLNYSEKQVTRWLKSGELTGYKFGRDWRIDPKDLDEFLLARRNNKNGGEQG